MLHYVHIPVMGICYTVDTPIRVSHLGLTSVISLVDDGLLEEYRMAYAKHLGMPLASESGRMERIRAYLDFVNDVAEYKFRNIRQMNLGGPKAINEKDRYFLMLPADCPLRAQYENVVACSGEARAIAEAQLTTQMEMGEIQANIMVSLDYKNAAVEAVRGFALSKVKGGLVLSAGVNLAVFEEISKHKCFYRILGNAPEKKIIIKVSDYRSALVQGRFLAKKGIEVYEYRIESGVNCGGHAFFEGGQLLPDVLKEFIERKQELHEAACKLIGKASLANATDFGTLDLPQRPSRITVQGGLCTADEVKLALSMGADGVGVGTPFLLVSEATSCDAETRKKLAAATPADVYVSHASPLGVPFMNLKTSTAAELVRKKTKNYFEQHNRQENADLAPGFPCRQHYLCREIPGFEHPVCMSSREYVKFRLAEIDSLEKVGNIAPEDACAQRKLTLERECICRFLGNGGRKEIEKYSEKVAMNQEPVSICPGPGIAYFNREYSLLEMMRHLYGTGPSVCDAQKPHAFEIEAKLMESEKLKK